jgi:hypothetical protein
MLKNLLFSIVLAGLLTAAAAMASGMFRSMPEDDRDPHDPFRTA